MAKPMFSGVGIVDMQNSLASTTFSRNAYGTYSKMKIAGPAITPEITAWRTVVAGLNFDWANIMTDTDRKAWYKLYIRRKNNMATVKMLNGKNAYLSVNMNLAMIPLPPIYTPPAHYTNPRLPDLISFTTLNTGSIVVSLAAPNSFHTAVYISAAKSPGCMSLNQIYFYLGVILPGTFNLDFYPAWFARFGALASGRKLFAKALCIDQFTGARSTFQCTSGIVI